MPVSERDRIGLVPPDLVTVRAEREADKSSAQLSAAAGMSEQAIADTTGTSVTFTAPATGSSGTFANGTDTTTVVTIATGVATSTPIPGQG